MKHNFLLSLLVGTILVTGACTNSKTTESTLPSYLSAQMAKGTQPFSKGMVAAANPHAVEAGIAALRAGGSAVDAALAVQTILGLVEPQSSGIGGGAFMVYYDAQSGKVTAYNGREKAPSTITETLFLKDDGERMGRFNGTISGRSTGVPGMMAMMHMAHTDHGKLAWANGFHIAEKMAENGFTVSPRMAGIVKRTYEQSLSLQPAAKAYFSTANGEPIPEGFLRDNKLYASSMRALAADPRALYVGPLAQAIVDATQAGPRPGTLNLQDMKAYTAQKSEALCSPYRTYIVCGAQAPSSGGVAVQSILGQLENFDMAKLGPSLQGWHVFAEASAQAYADRDMYVADPDFVEVPSRALLDPAYLKSRAENIQMDSALKNVKAGDPVAFKNGKDATPDNPGTSHFTVVDKWGNVVSMTTTVESAFGNRRMAGGFMLNNQLTDFSWNIRDKDGNLIANRPSANKRPRSSMAPHIVFDQDGTFAFSTGSPGGSSIIAYTAKTIIAMIDWGMSPQEATDLTNFISRNGRVRLEEKNMPEEIITGLEALGHNVTRSKGEISGIHIIKRNADGSYTGSADPRREGIAKSE